VFTGVWKKHFHVGRDYYLLQKQGKRTYDKIVSAYTVKKTRLKNEDGCM
jgi:hypothetical protein